MKLKASEVFGTPNLVEMLTEESAFDQPCKYGNRVESHAVYCHNDKWKDAPMKCRHSWYYGGEKGNEDKDCKGFKPNPNYKVKKLWNSKCCGVNAEPVFSPDDIGGKIGTCYFKCSKCQKPCDISPIIRGKK